MIFLGLGSNIGDRLAHLQAAIRLLQERHILEKLILSPIYESPALLKPGAPEEWNIPFFNMVVGGTSNLTPETMLAGIKAIEQELGREARGVWAPREIDIDILAWDNNVLETEALTIPHKLLTERAFVVLPFSDIAPDWVHPVHGKSLVQLREKYAINTAQTVKTAFTVNA